MSIKLIATQTGFYQGARVRPGQEFDFHDKDAQGKDLPLPKWAYRKGTPEPQVKARRIDTGDTKPKKAIDAATKKLTDTRDLV